MPNYKKKYKFRWNDTFKNKFDLSMIVDFDYDIATFKGNIQLVRSHDFHNKYVIKISPRSKTLYVNCKEGYEAVRINKDTVGIFKYDEEFNRVRKKKDLDMLTLLKGRIKGDNAYSGEIFESKKKKKKWRKKKEENEIIDDNENSDIEETSGLEEEDEKEILVTNPNSEEALIVTDFGSEEEVLIASPNLNTEGGGEMERVEEQVEHTEILITNPDSEDAFVKETDQVVENTTEKQNELLKKGYNVINFCSKCGNNIDSEDVFCKYCGMKLKN